MTAWEWEAGSASGVSDDEVAARGHAAKMLWSGEAHKAVVWQVVIITGYAALDGHYQPIAGTRVEGRRHGEGIQWLRANGPRSGG